MRGILWIIVEQIDRDHGRQGLQSFCKGLCLLEEVCLLGLGLEIGGEAKENLTCGCVGTWEEEMRVQMVFVYKMREGAYKCLFGILIYLSYFSLSALEAVGIKRSWRTSGWTGLFFAISGLSCSLFFCFCNNYLSNSLSLYFSFSLYFSLSFSRQPSFFSFSSKSFFLASSSIFTLLAFSRCVVATPLFSISSLQSGHTNFASRSMYIFQRQGSQSM